MGPVGIAQVTGATRDVLLAQVVVLGVIHTVRGAALANDGQEANSTDALGPALVIRVGAILHVQAVLVAHLGLAGVALQGTAWLQGQADGQQGEDEG